MLRTVNEYLVIFGRQKGGGGYQGCAACCAEECSERQCKFCGDSTDAEIMQSVSASHLTSSIWMKMIRMPSAAFVLYMLLGKGVSQKCKILTDGMGASFDTNERCVHKVSSDSRSNIFALLCCVISKYFM